MKKEVIEKTEKKDIARIKGGQNVYLVLDDIDIKSLRDFQKTNHCLQSNSKKFFKFTPPNFKRYSIDRLNNKDN